VLIPAEPRVAECGDGVAVCQCGDTIVADYTLPTDLTCHVEGVEAALVVASGANRVIITFPPVRRLAARGAAAGV
jgi:hypothetical protein